MNSSRHIQASHVRQISGAARGSRRRRADRTESRMGDRRVGVSLWRRRLAFTLLELMVAVGASVLIALALAQLFRTTGDTVTKGRRAAYFNSYAAMIQRTLAADFAQMSRSGYMVIRHEVTSNEPTNTNPNAPAPTQAKVNLFRGQAAAAARPRRIDELMFFAEGSFASAREAAHPDLVARSSQARIYYGHGKVAPSNPTPGAPNYAVNTVFNFNNVAAGRFGEVGRPNTFASDWILLRHQTLLAVPGAISRDFPVQTPDQVWGLNPTGNTLLRMQDRDRQIAVTPAAASIFRAMNRAPQPNNPNAYPVQGGWARPNILTFNSGLVDIATTDLAEVRAYVMQMHDGAAAPAIPQPTRPNQQPGSPSLFGVTLPVPQSFTPRIPNSVGASMTNDQRDLLYNMHAWMRNGMPTNSHADPFMSAAQLAEAPRTRIRCADFARNLPAILNDTSLQGAGKQFQRADLISNERMLTASNFVPHCSEFIVEWSFGESSPFTGEPRWYGTSIPNDTNSDGVAETLAFTYYDYDGSNDPPVPTLFLNTQTGEYTTDASQHPVDPRLIYGAGFDTAASARPLAAHFGFTDPTYEPASGNDLPTLPWAWPTMVRITITLADPSDTTLERTFQYVFKTPPTARN